MVIASLFIAYKILRTHRYGSLDMAILFFIAYIMMSALIISAGRCDLNIYQAATARYATPTLMLLSALIFIYFSFYREKLRSWGNKIYILLLPLGLFFSYQLTILSTDETGVFFNRKLAALALELNVNDEQQFRFIYPAASVKESAAYAKQHDWFVFNDPQIKNAYEIMGTFYESNSVSPCIGHIDGQNPINEDKKYIKINGWIYQPEDKLVPEKVVIVDKHSKVIGYAITGQPRSDVKKHLAAQSTNSGFEGYLLSEYAHQPISLIGVNPDCILKRGKD